MIGAVDKPNSRKVHRGVMPRLGGLALYLGFVVAVLLTQPLTSQVLGLLIGGTLIVLVGIADDLWDVPPVLKLLGQVVAASILVAFNIKVDFITNPVSHGLIPLGLLSVPVTVFWVIAITNAINLIDGLDGLAAGVAAIAALTLAVVAWTQGQMLVVILALILAAGIFGFLKYNFNPASIFMGDTGSMFLGFNLGALAIMGVTKVTTLIALFIPVLVLGIPIFDTLFAIIRRYGNNQPIFQADKEHLHHRLLALGLTHRQTVLAIYGLNLLLSGSAFLLTRMTTAQAMMILAVVSVLALMGAERLGVIGNRRAASAAEKTRQPLTPKTNPSHNSRGISG